MRLLLFPALITLIFILVESKRAWWKYALIFLAFFAFELAWYSIMCLEAKEYKPKIELSAAKTIERIKQQIDDDATLTPAQRDDFEKKIKMHKADGKEAFNKANKHALLIPDVDDRDVAKKLFETAIATSIAAKTWSSVVVGVLALFVEYCLNVYDQWVYIQHQLNLAKYNFEMMEFYQDCLRKG